MSKTIRVMMSIKNIKDRNILVERAPPPDLKIRSYTSIPLHFDDDDSEIAPSDGQPTQCPVK